MRHNPTNGRKQRVTLNLDSGFGVPLPRAKRPGSVFCHVCGLAMGKCACPQNNRCRRGHDHTDWPSAFRCSFDSVSPRDADGRLIESPAPAEAQPQQAALNFEEGQ